MFIHGVLLSIMILSLQCFSFRRMFFPRKLSIFRVEACKFRFLESNTWDLSVNNVNIFLDPVMSQLDFGIPSLYSGNKKYIKGPEEMDAVASKSDFVLISQGYDDHAHGPTLAKLSRRFPLMKYICPPSAKSILTNCGIREEFITTIQPGESKKFTNSKNSTVEIKATSGALLGPPWQAKENGYLIRGQAKADSLNKYEVYYEPHCMYDELELSQYKADIVITPVTAQELPAFTLVAGGQKALRLSQILEAKFVIPMANGNLKQSGLLAAVIRSSGSEGEFSGLLERLQPKTKLIPAPAGKELTVLL